MTVARATVARVDIRAALISAAQDLVAEQGTGMAIQSLVDRAGVAVGSLYNYFGTKDGLLAAATYAALADFEDYMRARTATVQDPIDRFTINVRLYGRMPDTHPTYALVLTRTSREILALNTGYNPKAMADVRAMLATGKARCTDPELVLMSISGAMERLLALRINNPDVGPDRADDLAVLGLTWFGLTRPQARRRVRKPLPPWPPD